MFVLGSVVHLDRHPPRERRDSPDADCPSTPEMPRKAQPAPLSLELAELLDRLASPWEHAQNVEANLASEERASQPVSPSVPPRLEASGVREKRKPTVLLRGRHLADRDLVALLHAESRRAGAPPGSCAASRSGRVLRDEVEVFSADDDGPVHLGGHDGARQDTAADGDEAGEGALLVWKGRIRVSPPVVPFALRSQLPRPTPAWDQPLRVTYRCSCRQSASLGVLKPRPTFLYCPPALVNCLPAEEEKAASGGGTHPSPAVLARSRGP